MKLKVSSNGRYFVDQDDSPFFYLGDTAWLLFQRLDREEVDDYLKDRAGKGFTVIQAYVLRGLDARHPDGATSLIGAAPLVDRDPGRPNEAFFANVDHVVNRANELGLVMGLVVGRTQSGHGWGAKAYQFVAGDYGLWTIKPTVDMEPPYDNQPTRAGPRIDSHQVRKGAYWAMLAGAAGHGYGALDLFHLYKEEDGPFPRDGFLSWRQAIAYEGSRQVGFMRRLFELRPWY